jgi:hypothetical protein
MKWVEVEAIDGKRRQLFKDEPGDLLDGFPFQHHREIVAA